MWTVYQGRGELHEGKASVLSRQLVLDKADVVGQEIGVGRQHCQDGLNRGQRGYVSEDDGCTEVEKKKKGRDTAINNDTVSHKNCSREAAFVLQ